MFFWSFYSPNNRENMYIHKYMKQHNTAFINVSWASNQHIKMISEGSCDTDAKNSDLITQQTIIFYYSLYFHIEISYLKR